MRQCSLGEQEEKHRFENGLVVDARGMCRWFCGWGNVLLVACWWKYQSIGRLFPLLGLLLWTNLGISLGKLTFSFSFIGFDCDV